MQDTINHLSQFIPVEIDYTSIVTTQLLFCAAVIVIGFLAKVLLGKNSNLNRSICGSIGILFIYAISITVYTFNPGNLAGYLSPLPYVIFSHSKLYLFVFQGTIFSVICSQALSMTVLAFLYHLMDDFIPRGKGFHWLLYRLLTVIMATALFYVANWAMNAFLPAALVFYAPTVVLIILITLLILGVLKVILGFVLIVVNPVISALYGFFFSSRLGKQLTRALLSTMILSLLVMLLHHFGYSVISVSISSLTAYIPLILILLALWYLFSIVF